jgi:hypothetical protein
MRIFFGLTAIVLATLGAFSVLVGGPSVSASPHPEILDFAVVGYLRMEQNHDIKLPEPRPVHVMPGTQFDIIARTRDVERLDVAVLLGASDGFGVFSGTPDANGIVRLTVSVPEGGSMQFVRVPGRQGETVPWLVPERTVFMLQPTAIVSADSDTGFVSYGPNNEPAIIGEPIWVRKDE